MINYEALLTTIAGSPAARALRIALTVCEMVDFCSGRYELPLPVGVAVMAQIETLLPAPLALAREEILAVMHKKRGGLHAGDRTQPDIQTLTQRETVL